MSNHYHGHAMLRDLGPAGGVYEVDCTIQTSVQHSRHIGVAAAVHNVSSVDIRTLGGCMLKDGAYALDGDDGEICKLTKTGALWALMPDKPASKKRNSDERRTSKYRN